MLGIGPCHSSLYLCSMWVDNDPSIFPTMPVAGQDSPNGMEAKGWALDALNGSQPSLHQRSGTKAFARPHCFSALLVTP